MVWATVNLGTLSDWKMTGDEIRNAFINFFEEKGHQPMPSASLIPAGDPTLLFTSAGMVPFKPFFTGEQTPPSRRLTSSQKSFRTTDIDEVGDHKHLTFFEMLGNFSIGDYFKEGAVAFAWELVTQRFGLDPDRIFVTIHLDDDEAFEIWRDQVGIPPERIYRYGDKDNWWGPAGNEGATGPCSELHYDGGRERGCHQGRMVAPDVLTGLQAAQPGRGMPLEVPGCHPNCDCERFVELWNLVFMQFYQDTQGSRTPLPAPSVDTGMGLERAAVLLQGKSNIYECDLFQPIIQKACELTGTTYGDNPDTDYALRVVAEHTRAACFLIGDGVVPANEGRGYVLRRVIRRAIRHGRRLGIDPSDSAGNTSTFLAQVAEEVLVGFRHVYGELAENQEFILRVLNLEEERFGQTMDTGSRLLDEGLIPLRESLQARLQNGNLDQSEVHAVCEDAAGTMPEWVLQRVSQVLSEWVDAGEQGRQQLAGSLSGAETFILYDTYGFPPELTAEIAREHGLDVDMDGFHRAMEEARQLSRASHVFRGGMEVQAAYENLGVERTGFVGYQGLIGDTVVAAILVGQPGGTDASTNSEDAEGLMTPAGHAVQGQRVEIVLQESPFYPEGGGQQGDVGTITSPNGEVSVEDTNSPVAGLIVHRGVVRQGDISLGEPVTAQVDRANRLDASRNHSSTHLLHAALRSVLGPHVRQAGSLVSPDRLRFDFSHVTGLSSQELRSVQGLANDKIRDNLLVSSHETSYAQAVRDGALAFFGDRYGDVVRVVSMADPGAEPRPFSMEVCGGTHVAATGQLGTLCVLGESSIGGGMRRIEAISGRAAEQLFLEQSDRLATLSNKLQTPVADLESRLDIYIQDNEMLRARLEVMERTALRSEAEQLLQQVVEVDGVKLVAAKTSASSPDAMREMGDFLKARLSSVAIVLGAVVDGNPLLVAMLTRDLVDRGLHAGNLASDTAKVMGGGGGGRPDMAQAGGRQPERLGHALAGVAELVRRGLAT